MPRFKIRSAGHSDRELISALLASAQLRHIHLDWLAALDLADKQLFLLAMLEDLPVACLAAPPDPLPCAWLRVFASSQDRRLNVIWDALWSALYEEAKAIGIETFYSLALHSWFEPLLTRSGFSAVNEVIFYEWRGSAGVLERDATIKIRKMRQGDIAAVGEIDHDAFAPAWQNSIQTLSIASQLSTYASVAEVDGELVGYQISTASALGAHLARLAVRNAFQRRGVGRALVVDMLKHIARRGFNRATVNTQADNLGSQHLYRNLGFQPTGKRYPMYTRKLA